MSGPATDQRILTLDVAKGLGIVLVVLGHNSVFREGRTRCTRRFISSNAAVFLFVGRDVSRWVAGEALIKRARALLVPYFVMGALALLMAFNGGGLEAATRELLGVLYGTGHTLRFVPLWFLPCLFVVSMSATLLLAGARAAMTLEGFEKRRVGILCAIAIVGLGLGSLVLVSQRFAPGSVCRRHRSAARLSRGVWICCPLFSDSSSSARSRLAFPSFTGAHNPGS